MLAVRARVGKCRTTRSGDGCTLGARRRLGSKVFGGDPINGAKPGCSGKLELVVNAGGAGTVGSVVCISWM